MKPARISRRGGRAERLDRGSCGEARHGGGSQVRRASGSDRWKRSRFADGVLEPDLLVGEVGVPEVANAAPLPGDWRQKKVNI
jgi:hypothetical protein